MAQLVKNPSAMQETWVRSLGWEDPLEKGTATHSSIPTPVIWSGEFHGLCSPWGHKESDMTEQLSLYFHKFKQKKRKEKERNFSVVLDIVHLSVNHYINYPFHSIC